MWEQIRQFKERPKRKRLSVEDCFASRPPGSRDESTMSRSAASEEMPN
jgi:hypothetical protein